MADGEAFPSEPNSLEPSPTAPLVKPKSLTGDEATVGLGFDRVETNCRIAHILGTLLIHFYFNDIIVVCAV